MNITEEYLYHVKPHAGKFYSLVACLLSLILHCILTDSNVRSLPCRLHQATMCAGDVSSTTVKWDKGKKMPGVELEGNSTHWCVDWDGLMESTADRVVSEEEFICLVNPLG